MSVEKNVPGSRSPYTVWLSCCSGGVVGVTYHSLNRMIEKYNKKRMYRYVDFWEWYSYEEFNQIDYIRGFSTLWNEHNKNMRFILQIKTGGSDYGKK